MKTKYTIPWTSKGSVSGQKDIKWAEGLRGIASLLVVTSHISRAFAPTLLGPALENSDRPSLFYLPFFRLPAQGPPWVALFFLLTGYVNAMKPIKQARSGNINQALTGLASSTLRRSARLVLPAIVATVASWIICQAGGYKIGRMCAAAWIRDTSPDRIDGVVAPIQSVFVNSFTTWSTGANIYDPVQWTLPFLLKGSMVVYMALLATVQVQSKYRVLVLVGMYAFSWAARDPMTGMNIYFGALLAEISTSANISPATGLYRHASTQLVPAVALLSGLYLSGYPEMLPESAPWSDQLAKLGSLIFPTNSEIWRFFPALGAQLVALAILLSPLLQEILSHPALVWLGGLSFPLYLIHGPLIRSFLAWMVFGFQNSMESNVEDIADVTLPFPAHLGKVLAVALPLFFTVLLLLAHLWTLTVDAWCARIIMRVEEIMYADKHVTSEKEVERRDDGLWSPV